MQCKIILSVILITICGYHSNSQSLAVNTDGSSANASALLDIKSINKGVLIPRMTRTERNAIASPATGLLIFQNGPDSIGFHYHDGTKWTWLFSNSNTDSLAWKTAGNTGTNDANNFIGTRDNIPFNIRVNNQKAGRIDNTLANSFFGYQAGNANPAGANNTAIGHEALKADNTGYSNVSLGYQTLMSNTAGYQNVAIGKTSMLSNISGYNNTAVGVQSLYLNTTGIDNTAYGPNSLFYNNGDGNSAYGWSSLFNNATGNYNTAVGYYASGLNTTGYSNVAIGAKALYSNTTSNNLVAIGDSSLYNTTGTNNTALGSKAGYSLTTGNGNVFLGYQAGYNVTTASNKLYIANNSTDPPIIYGDFSNKTLGLGTITPNSTYGYAKVEIASEGFGSPADLLIRNAANDAGYAPAVIFQHARGTLATPLTVNNGDYLSSISTMNHDGSNYILSAGLDIYADGAVAPGIVPTRLQFNTMNTSGSYASRLTIKNNGKVGIGTTAPAAKLHIGGGTRFTVLDTGSIFLQSGNTIGSARDWKIYVPMPQGYLSFRDMGFDNLNNGMSTDAMVIQYGTGNVGIGATVPNSTLHVDGTIAIGTSLNIAGGTSGSPVSLLNQKSYVAVLPANAVNNYYQLPDPSLYPGRMYIVRNNSSVSTANITTAAGLLFPGNSNVGVATYTLNPTTSPKTVMAISDGSNWTIMVQN